MQLHLGRLIKWTLLILKKPTPVAPLGAVEIPIRPPWLKIPPSREDPFMPEWLVMVILGAAGLGSRLMALHEVLKWVSRQPTRVTCAFLVRPICSPHSRSDVKN